MSPSARHLRKGARHANYGMRMLHETASWLNERIQEPIYSAALESWAAHVRNLIEFFHTASTRYPDTVRAEWYVADPIAWSKDLPPLSKRDRKRRVALHKHLTHISYERDGRKTHWSMKDDEIVLRRLRVFKKHLPKKRLAWCPDIDPYPRAA